MNIIKKISLSVAGCLLGLSTFAQLTVNSSVTPTYLVNNVLLGSGITATGITYTGSATARGEFNGVASNIGFNSGLILASGNITTAIGPNNIGSAGTDLGNPGDPDLDMICSNTTYDAAVLEFDFVPMSDTLKFNFVFASEEYLEFVGLGVNDAFGFFLSGPGVSGPYSGGAANIALIPGTAVPVTIDNVNASSYPAFYFNNETPPGATVQYDGFTIPMQAKSPVQCGQTYHIKIAIADAGDGVYDSGVFLEGGSFTSQGVNIVPNISYGGSNDSVLYEGCGTACIDFIRTSNLANSDTINVTIGGTATNGIDFNTGVSGVPLPTQLIYAPGQDTITYCINAVDDLLSEGQESIVLSIVQTGPCIATTTSATIYLDEHHAISVSVNDTAFCNSGGSLNINALVSGGVPPYTYSWTGGLPPIPNPSTGMVSSTTSYVVTVSDACTNSPIDPTPDVTDTSTVTVAVVDPISLSIGPDLVVCPGDNLNLNSAITGGLAPFVYNWSTVTGTDTVMSTNTPNTSLIASGNGVYQLAVEDVCHNTGNDQLIVTVETSCALNIPNIITPDGTGPAENEFFYVENLDKFPGSTLKIYNRWGNKIYESDNYQNNWSGGGHPDGTYYYVLTVPMSGTNQAKANAQSIAAKSFKEAADDTKKVFAGFFQLSALK